MLLQQLWHVMWYTVCELEDENLVYEILIKRLLIKVKMCESNKCNWCVKKNKWYIDV